MYTTFIIDEAGNRRITMDWFESTNAPFNWCETTVERLVESHPNHTAGLEFAYYYTGDDYRPQSGRYVSPAFGLLPDFQSPDLPAPRAPLARTGEHTRTSEESRSVPVRKEVGAVGPTGRPRVRCGLCAWTLGLPLEWSGPGPEDRPEPAPFETPDHLKTQLKALILAGQTTRRRLATALTHKRRWNLVDRWLGRLEGSKVPALPTDAQLETLLTGIDDPPSDDLRAALEHDRTHRRLRAEARRWTALQSYVPWAETETREDGLYYRHHHCGRTTHDLDEVVKGPELGALPAMLSDGALDGEAPGDKTLSGKTPGGESVVLEEWAGPDGHWRSLALPRDRHATLEGPALDAAVRAMLEMKDSEALRWQVTPRFAFATATITVQGERTPRA